MAISHEAQWNSMSKPINFTRHAEQKFVDLAEPGFTVTRERVGGG
jgi:hypothetical protein